MQKLISMFALVFLLVGRTAEGLVSSDDDLGQYAGASLVVYSPASASIVEIGEPLELNAEIISAEGESLGFDAIEWTSSLAETGIFTGKQGDV